MKYQEPETLFSYILAVVACVLIAGLLVVDMVGSYTPTP